MEMWELKEPVPGDIIRIPVEQFYHFAIYLGNDEVVQFGYPTDFKNDPNEVRVMHSPIEDFLNGNFVEVRCYTKSEMKTKRDNKEVIKLALSRVGEGNYNILYNNCEHFVNDIVFGKKESTQVDIIRQEMKRRLGI